VTDTAKSSEAEISTSAMRVACAANVRGCLVRSLAGVAHCERCLVREEAQPNAGASDGDKARAVEDDPDADRGCEAQLRLGLHFREPEDGNVATQRGSDHEQARVSRGSNKAVVSHITPKAPQIGRALRRVLDRDEVLRGECNPVNDRDRGCIQFDLIRKFFKIPDGTSFSERPLI
jgi:hypothetical protein